jgi:DNA (cytosine-5)-methyltransferase 1
MNLKRIQQSKPGGSWRDWDENLLLDCHKKDSGKTYASVYGRMNWDEPAPTMTTFCTGIGNGRFGHPEQDRAISLREAALFQTFPKEYKFYPENEIPSISVISTHIGNAVPVKLGEVIAKSIKFHLRSKF